MSSPTLADPKIVLSHQIDTIRDYAQRMVVQEETLSPHEAAEHEARMRDFMAIGEAFGLTQKEMVGLVLGQTSPTKPGCGCHSCDARQQM